MINRKNILNAWERVMAAITFAEAGEPETARDIMEPTRKIKQRRRTKVVRQEKVRPDLRM